MRAWGSAIYRRRIAPVLVCIGAVFVMSCAFAKNTMAYQNIVIAIDPGHGGDGTEGETDSGAIYNGVKEKEVDMITAQALYEELSQYGNLTVYLTRTEDVHTELKDRVDFAKSVGADYLISVHYNASKYHRFYGAEIFTSAFGEEYAKGVSLAQTIMSWWVEDGRVSKGIKTRIGKNGDYYGLIRMGREAGIPTIILEHAYLDNNTDFDVYGTPEVWKRLGQLDATAIADYFGVKKGVVQADVGGELTVAVPTGQVDDDTTPPTDVTVTIDAYNPNTRELSYTISAKEPDSMLMYYDLNTQELAADEEHAFMHMNVWKNGETSMKGTYTVPEGYQGAFVARVYNNYEKYTDTPPITVPADLPGASTLLLGGTQVQPTGVAQAEGDAESTGTETPTVTLQDGSGATWTLDEALKEAKGAEYVVDHDQVENKNYALMIVALSVIGLLVVVSIVLAIATHMRRKKGRRR